MSLTQWLNKKAFDLDCESALVRISDEEWKAIKKAVKLLKSNRVKEKDSEASLADDAESKKKDKA